ncbi:MAG: ATP-dependent DNA helicase RecG [Pelagibacteraceae bacterium]|nr:MAG: ATP-dependent DNA helicase RecG [Pelagibacteraceae bacterium]
MNDNSFDFLYQNVEKLKGIGPKKASYFKNLNINTVIDIFYNLPTRSIDRTQDIDFKNLEKGQTITTLVKVKKHHFPFNPKLPYVIECEKGSLIINIIYFSIRGNFLRKKYPENKELIISGKVSFYKSNLSVAHPDYIEEIENEDKLRTFENIYPLTRGITLKDIRIVLNDAKNHLNKFDEWLNENIVKKYNFSSFNESLIKMHFPSVKEDIENRENFRKRLAVDELVSNYFAIRYLKEKTKRKNESLNLKFNLQEKLINELPFELTKNQYKIINDINNYNNTQYRETVLLQGDVGSGKTIVSLLTAIPFIQKHKQVAYMAPTEILANQIYSNVLNHLDNEEVNPILLTGSSKNKSKIYEKIEKGIFNFIIGTHAIFQENLNFSSLAYVIIDEQHRFGVQQRLYLAEKGINTNILLMSATPIPRTLALAQYGEIEQVILKEKPAFQKPIITKVSNIDKIKDIEILLKKKISNVSQVYWICPLVEASETQKYKDVETRFKSLKNIFGSEVEMLHGKIKSDQKERIIQNFQKGNIKILVATTVVEVGIDNKNADYIVIENAEKFGLSQLHQLRGRVGRGNNQGYCFALYGKDLPDNTINRLKIFKENLDGFKLSEKDLEIRGTGDILGYRQSGDSLFKFVNVYHDQELIIDALQYVKKLIEKKEYENEKFKKDIYKLLMFFKQQEAIKLLFS